MAGSQAPDDKEAANGITLDGATMKTDTAGHVHEVDTEPGDGVGFEGDNTHIDVTAQGGNVVTSHIGPGDEDAALDPIEDVELLDVDGERTLRITSNPAGRDGLGHATGLADEGAVEHDVVVPDEQVAVDEQGEPGFLDQVLNVDDEWLEKVIDAGVMTLQHIGPSTAVGNPYRAFHKVDVQDAPSPHVEFTDATMARDDRGHTHAPADAGIATAFLKLESDPSLPLIEITGIPAAGEDPPTVRFAIPGEQVEVVTDVRVDASTLKLQKKTRTIRVLEAETESGWQDVHEGIDCEDET